MLENATSMPVHSAASSLSLGHIDPSKGELKTSSNSQALF